MLRRATRGHKVSSAVLHPLVSFFDHSKCSASYTKAEESRGPVPYMDKADTFISDCQILLPGSLSTQ